MAEQSVVGADGREWTLRSDLEWRTPATAEGFEHDVAGGYVPAAVMVVFVVIFTIALAVWMPDSVVVPSWVFLLLLLVAAFFPLRWVLHRPVTVVAETDGDLTGGAPAERWVGTVRGLFDVRGEMKRLRQSIEEHSVPDVSGPLRPVE